VIAFCGSFTHAFAGDGERIVSPYGGLWFRNGRRGLLSAFCDALFVNRKFTPYETIQILRKFSRRKTLKIYRLVV